MANSNHNLVTAIGKLKGRENFENWKFATQAYLELEGLWTCVTRQETSELKLLQARSKLILLVDPVNYVHIQRANSAKEIWDNLRSAFEDSGLSRKVGESLHYATFTVSKASHNEWFLDSGASAHMTHDKSVLSCCVPITNEEVAMANKTVLPVSHKGSLKLWVHDGDDGTKFLEAEGVPCVPGLCANLLSVSELTKNGNS